jgi:hypothetical protein
VDNILDFNNAKRQDELAKGNISAESIRDRLNASAQGFVQWLFSGRALVSRGTARVGDINGTPGASLSINLTGPDTGLWKDHATEEGGDLIGLYRANMGYVGTADFVLSLKEIARDYLGDSIEIERPTWRPTPIDKIEAAKVKLGTKPRADMEALGAPVATYKYFDTHGTLLASVVRHEPDGTRASKTFRPWCYRGGKWLPGAPDLRPLYHLPSVATSPTVVLVEGEGKADALHSVGVVATSAMQGAGAPIEKTDWSPLSGKTVVIWPDNDEPGATYARAAAAKLASIGCRVKLVPVADKPAKWDAGDCVAEGGDVNAVLLTAVEVASQPKPRVRLLSISELAALPPPSWLIDGIIIENGLSMVWGRSGSLKSFVALDMGLCVATGLAWHGHAVKRGRVVYLAAEGARGLGGRAMGWMKNRGRGLPDPDFQIIPHGLTLVNSGDLDAMIAAIGTTPVALIVIDTLSRTFGGGNPNQPTDMNAFVMACYRLIEATGAQVLVVHHGGKDTDKNELGNEGLRNASDTVIHIRRKTTGVELINEAPKGKQKDYEEFKTIQLQAVKIHYEQNNTELSTLILNTEDAQKPAGSDEPVDVSELKLGLVEKKVADALVKAGTPLGLTRLVLMSGSLKRSVLRAIETLTEKGLVEQAPSGSENFKLWRLSND